MTTPPALRPDAGVRYQRAMPDPAAAPTTLYLISDLHIGGDGALGRCEFERELVDFLADVARGPANAELIIVGDAFGLWELTEHEGESKLAGIAANHPDLFAQLRATGERVRITLLPGNHDYELACVPAYAAELAAWNVVLEPRESVTRRIAGRTVWIEHGNQHDAFNAFPDFGNRYAQPLGYFITSGIVAAAGRGADRTKSKWLEDVESVQPNQDLPFWVISNHFYKDMAPWLRWALLPFLLLFTVSAGIFALRGVEKILGVQTGLFDVDLRPVLGFPGRLLDLVQFVNSAVIATLLILAIPGWFLVRDVREALSRYGLLRDDVLHRDKDGVYVAAAQKVFANDPSVAVFVYGHTHTPSLRDLGGRLVINTGTWLKRLEYVPVRLGRLPGIWVPSYRLNWFTIDEDGGALRVRYAAIDKAPPRDLTWLERLLIVGRRPAEIAAIPAETRLT